jgi:predicted O-methyltransferase YrrM
VAEPAAGRVARFARALRARVAPTAEDRLWRAARAVGMTQKRAEILGLARLVGASPPRAVVEIGTSAGGTFRLWTLVAAADATLVSVDLPPWPADDPREAAKVRELEGFRRERQAVHVLRADSHAPATRARVAALLGGRPLDFLFVDGDHAYEGVRRDFLDYAPLVRPGGLVAFHDVRPHSGGWGGDVPRFWAELAAERPTRVLVEDEAQDGFGIGLVWM